MYFYVYINFMSACMHIVCVWGGGRGKGVEEGEGEDKRKGGNCIRKLICSCYCVDFSLLPQMDAMNKMRSITELVQSKAYKDKVKSLLWL